MKPGPPPRAEPEHPKPFMRQPGLPTQASEIGHPKQPRFRIFLAFALALVALERGVLAEEPPAENAVVAEESSAPGDEEAFLNAMSTGIKELSRGRPSAARKAFERGASLRPGDPAAREGLLQADLAIQLASLSATKKRALDLEKGEEWTQAADVYRNVLARHPELVFARSGLRRSEERGALLVEIDQLISSPERLESRAVLERASNIAKNGESIAENGTITAERAQELQRLIEEASTTVAVSFLSDGQTQVQVYKVGNLGSFEEREVPLPPGTYTVIGSRDGYRDVRQQIRVESGKTPDLVRVICKEPLR